MKKLHSPFPGMDPFLEHPADWRGVQSQLLVAISNFLQKQLSERFVVRIRGADYSATDPTFPISYDASSHRNPDQFLRLGIDPPDLLEPDFPLTVEERWLEIIELVSRKTTTFVEILAPFGKIGKGFNDFMHRRNKVLNSTQNWVEIDLLRAGKRSFSLVGRKLPDYYALVKYADKYELMLWQISLHQQLPIISVPLTEPHENVPLDLQAVIDQVYLEGRYAQIINYDDPIPAPQLSAEKEQWVCAQITSWRKEREQ